MQLMRIGEAGREKPVVRVDDSVYVDVSDFTKDFDGAFFAERLDDLKGVVADRVQAGRVHQFGGDLPQRFVAGDGPFIVRVQHLSKRCDLCRCSAPLA